MITCGLTSIIGLILSIIGLIKSKDYNENGKGLSIAGIVISGVFIFMFIFFFAIGMSLPEETSDDSYINETEEIEKTTTRKQETTTKKEETVSSGIKKGKFTLLEGYKGYSDEYNFGYYIEGYVQNNSNWEYDYVQISFNLYDEEGVLIGTALDNINNLEAKGKWKFKAISLMDSEEVKNVASYKLKEITGW